MVDVQPDWKPAKRVKDKGVMKRLHVRGVVCVICGNKASLHHLYPRGQGGDDVESNLIGLCGSGTTGCHGLIENGDVVARIALGAYLYLERPDFFFYLQAKLGESEGREWLKQRYFLSI
jgi:hypothetical protein